MGVAGNKGAGMDGDVNINVRHGSRDSVGGDKITTGDVFGSGTSVGRGASAGATPAHFYGRALDDDTVLHRMGDIEVKVARIEVRIESTLELLRRMEQEVRDRDDSERRRIEKESAAQERRMEQEELRRMPAYVTLMIIASVAVSFLAFGYLLSALIGG